MGKKYAPKSKFKISVVLNSDFNWRTKVYFVSKFKPQLIEEYGIEGNLNFLKKSYDIVDIENRSVVKEDLTQKRQLFKILRALNCGYTFNVEYLNESTSYHNIDNSDYKSVSYLLTPEKEC